MGTTRSELHAPQAYVSYTAEFRRRLLDLIASGLRVADVASDVGISDQTVYEWRHQDRVAVRFRGASNVCRTRGFQANAL